MQWLMLQLISRMGSTISGGRNLKYIWILLDLSLRNHLQHVAFCNSLPSASRTANEVCFFASSGWFRILLVYNAATSIRELLRRRGQGQIIGGGIVQTHRYGDV
jgi:hypothetical protein